MNTAFRNARLARLPALVLLAALAGAARHAAAANVHDGFNATTDDAVFAAVLQPDGKLLLGGAFTQVDGQPRAHVARLNVDGSLDASFDAQLDGSVRSLLVQSDGAILVGGDFTQVAGQARSHLARLNADGSLDATFDPAPNQPVRSLAVQFDDKILVGGDFTHLADAARAHLARLNLDGSLDPAFSADADAAVLALAPQPDGRLLAGGDFTQIGGQAQAHLARLGADGSPDAGFAAADGRVASLALDIDGSVLVGGDFAQIAGQARARLARLEADGTVDAGFAAEADGAVSSLALQPDGGVLVGGAFTQIGGEPRSHLARLAADGTPEAGFDPAPDAAVAAIAVQADGGIVLGGAFAHAGGEPRAHVARVYVGGALDRDLAPALTTGGSFVTFAAQADNRIVMIGDVQAVDGQAVPNAARLEADGSLDAAFTSRLPPWVFASTSSIYTQFDGSILFPGRVMFDGAAAYSDLFRLGADGTLDTTFDAQFGSATDPYPQVVTEQPDGKILVAGSFDSVAGQTRYGLARLHADGSLDETFVPPYVYPADGTIQYLAVQADGKVLLAGYFSQVGPDPNTHRFLARLNADGSLDAGFNPVMDRFVSAALPQTDGRILVAGFFRTVNGQPAPFIARLNADGSLDSTFSAAADSLVSAVTPLSNGKLVIGGVFKKIGGVPQPYIARLNADGSLDPSFAPAVSVTPSLSIVSLAVQPDGKVLVGATEAMVIDGESRPLVARLSANEAALQTLAPSADRSRLEWRRGGGAPLLDSATFEFSVDGDVWTSLGEAVAGDGVWSVDAAALPRDQDVRIRARGRSPSGRQDASSLPIEFVSRLRLADGFTVSPVARAGGGFSPAVPQQVAAGAGTSFTVVPQSGYAIGQVEGCGGTLDGEVYTIAAVNADCRIVATFVPNGITDRVFADGFDGATP